MGDVKICSAGAVPRDCPKPSVSSLAQDCRAFRRFPQAFSGSCLVSAHSWNWFPRTIAPTCARWGHSQKDFVSRPSPRISTLR